MPPRSPMLALLALAQGAQMNAGVQSAGPAPRDSRFGWFLVKILVISFDLEFDFELSEMATQ